MVEPVRLFKQLIIGFIVLILAGGAYFALSHKFSTPVATPTPDPRAKLAPVEVTSSKLITVGAKDYDFLARLKNPNAEYGSPKVTYELTFYGSSGEVVSKRTGTTYILPGQTKYVLVTPIPLDQEATGAQMRITAIDWEQLDDIAKHGVSFIISGARFSQGNGTISGRVQGSVVNDSNFDVNQVDVVVVLQNATGEPVAANRTEIRTFLAKTTRGFEVAWFSPLSQNDLTPYVEANTNVFESTTFIRTYGGHERFQQLY